MQVSVEVMVNSTLMTKLESWARWLSMVINVQRLFSVLEPGGAKETRQCLFSSSRVEKLCSSRIHETRWIISIHLD